MPMYKWPILGAILMVSLVPKTIAQKQIVDTTTLTSNAIWMESNLAVDVFRNGDKIPQAQSDEAWQEAGFNEQPAWCYYSNENGRPEKGAGKLYNRFALSDPRGLAPLGWHIAKTEEWLALEKKNSERAKALDFLLSPEEASKVDIKKATHFGLYGWRDVGFGGWGNSVTFWMQGEDPQAMLESVPTVSFSREENEAPSTFNYSSTSWIMGHYVRCVKD